MRTWRRQRSSVWHGERNCLMCITHKAPGRCRCNPANPRLERTCQISSVAQKQLKPDRWVKEKKSKQRLTWAARGWPGRCRWRSRNLKPRTSWRGGVRQPSLWRCLSAACSALVPQLERHYNNLMKFIQLFVFAPRYNMNTDFLSTHSLQWGPPHMVVNYLVNYPI